MKREVKRAKITKRQRTYKGKTTDYWVVSRNDLDNGKRPEKWLRNKRHAEAYASKIDRDTERGVHEAGSGKKTFGEVWKAWIAHCEERRKLGALAGNTLENYYWGGDHILPEFGQRQIGKITSPDVEAWVFKKLAEVRPLTGKPLARHSVTNFYQYLFLALKYAVRKKWLASNPLLDDPVRVPGEKENRAEHVPTFEDVELLIQILHGPAPAWCHTLTWENQKIAFALRAFAGWRAGEIAALRWDKIDMSRATLEVDKKHGSMSMIDGLKKPKSKAGARTIPMSQYLYDALLEHAHATDMKGFVIKNRADPADPNKYSSSQTVVSLHHDLMVWAKLMGPNGEVKFVGHDLRHWHISTMLAMGINLVAVSKRAGHSDPSVTTSTYAHVIEGTEDGLKDSVAPIWHQRLARAEPGRPPTIEGVATESSLLIEGTATGLLETPIPNEAYPWVPEAVRMLEGGWRVVDVTRHLKQCRTNINRAFHQLGLPNPDQIRRKVRDRMFGELIDAGYTDRQIAQKMNCSEGSVYAYRRTREAGVPNTKAEIVRLTKGQCGDGKKLTDDQVHEVWDRIDAGETFAAIAKRFSVTHGLIGNIKSGRNYGWVKQERAKNGGAGDHDKPLEHIEKQVNLPVVTAEKPRESQLKLL